MRRNAGGPTATTAAGGIPGATTVTPRGGTGQRAAPLFAGPAAAQDGAETTAVATLDRPRGASMDRLPPMARFFHAFNSPARSSSLFRSVESSLSRLASAVVEAADSWAAASTATVCADRELAAKDVLDNCCRKRIKSSSLFGESSSSSAGSDAPTWREEH